MISSSSNNKNYRFLFRPFLLFFSFLLLSSKVGEAENVVGTAFSVQPSVDNLAERSHTLLVSTIDGYLTAIDATTGQNTWRIKEGPLLTSPTSAQRGFTFIPDPRDGQLYLVVEGQINKLPFTIPHLVRVSPCRSSDGVFYAGSKKDIWISINPETGERIDTFSSSVSPSSYCPASHPRAIHIGKTEYQIQMVDTKHRDKHWNATFVDYSSHLLPEDVDYPLQHLTSSADGRVLTVDARSGLVLWQRDFSSVIVNMYLLKGDGMHRLPSTAVGQETFELLLQSASLNPQLQVPAKLPDRLFPTLFVGEGPRVGELYALSAFVDERTNRISPKYLGPPLLEGPKSEEDAEQKTAYTDAANRMQRKQVETTGTTYTNEEGEFLLLGYHEVPKFLLKSPEQIFPLTNDPFAQHGSNARIGFEQQRERQQQRDGNNLAGRVAEGESRILPIDQQQHPSNLPIGLHDGILFDLLHFAQKHPYPTSIAFAVFIALLISFSCLWGKHSALSRHRTISNGSSITMGQNSDLVASADGGTRSSRGSSVYTAYEPTEEEGPLGWHRVNNSALSYNSAEVLGRGCDGTIVFIGKFDGRSVAVKRIVSANLDRALRLQIEREVMHLRQSDSHPNVIRYFCSESDRYFHYIALEYCDLSLEDFIKHQKCGPLNKTIRLGVMKQAADGISHLHRINIIHRDVKPKNILLTGLSSSFPNNNIEQVRIKISDFGLCKSVKLGHNSISKVSGAVGTEGWMAPELFDSDTSVTYAVDVFSLGCVFYYTLTDGQHPFGVSLSRMSNILCGNHCLDHLDENEENTSRMLIEAMVRPLPARRPSASAVAAHPLFWPSVRQLQFLMDVSDWIEKKEPRDPVMRRLEWRRQRVFTNWLDQVDEPLRVDLLKQRPYLDNVRDLLRAIRNKKHHYQELSLELRTLLGAIPGDYLAYFTTRFPKLLMHAFMALACIGNESEFRDYYSPDQLRDFYEREQIELAVAHGLSERRSQSPTNWRTSNGNLAQPQKQIMTRKNLFVSSTNTTTLTTSPIPQQLSFNPSIPPPSIATAIGFVAPPQSQLDNAENGLHFDGKELSLELLSANLQQQQQPSPITTNSVVAASPTKNQKAGKKGKRKKKKKAPFSVLMEAAQVEGEEDEEEGGGEEVETMEGEKIVKEESEINGKIDDDEDDEKRERRK